MQGGGLSRAGPAVPGSTRVMVQCCGTKYSDTMESDQDRRRITEQIDRQIAEDKKKMQRKVKILLLGCGEAGKVRRK